MNLSKSIDFLLEQSGPVIQYRLRKDILHTLTKEAEEEYLDKIYRTRLYQMVESYAKPNGYIGSGMHSWSNWRGQVLQKTPLQDGETAARLLAYYGVPKEHPLVVNFVRAMKDPAILEQEFSYIPPEKNRFLNRYQGINSGGNSLMVLLYTMQALLGYGDEGQELQDYQQICLRGFQRIMEISSLDQITSPRESGAGKYRYPYLLSQEYFPDSYSLATLAYTKNWRTPQTMERMTDSINRIQEIMSPDNLMHIKINGKYMGPFGALIKPFRPYSGDIIDSIMYRRPLTELAKLGIGQNLSVLQKTRENLEDAMAGDGILRIDHKIPHNPRYSPRRILYPTAYSDVRLEEDNSEYSLCCDLTFWAVEFITEMNQTQKIL